MKKLLIASTALSLAGGAAFAEMAITVSGDAELGVDYASEPVADATTGAVGSKHSFVHEVGIDFEGSGTTDGGLTFGGKAGFDTGDTEVNTGEVYVSGSFGKLTIGDNDAADLTAGGIADIGMNGIGVDDMVEGLRGTTAAQLRYDNSFGQVSIAISAGTKAGSAAKAAVPATVWHINDHMTGDKMTTHVYYPDLTATGRVAHPDGVIIHTANASPTPDNDNPSIHTEYTIKWDPTAEMYYGLTRTATDSADVPTTIVKHEFDSIFGVIHRSEDGAPDDDVDNNAVIVDLDLVIAEAAGVTAAQAEADQVNIYGFMRNDKDQIVGPDGKVYAATTDHGKAFTRYEANYNLGGDKKVGGTGKTAEAENRDTVKVASNAMAAVPAVASDSEFAFGMSFNAGGVTIGVGYDSNKTVNMGAGFTTGEITTNLLYVKTEDNEDTEVDEEMTGMGVDMAYTMGASKVTLAYGRRKPEMGEAMDAVGMDVEHDLGGDATLKAGFGKVDKMVGTKMVSENKASIGLMFAF